MVSLPFRIAPPHLLNWRQSWWGILFVYSAGRLQREILPWCFQASAKTDLTVEYNEQVNIMHSDRTFCNVSIRRVKFWKVVSHSMRCSRLGIFCFDFLWNNIRHWMIDWYSWHIPNWVACMKEWVYFTKLNNKLSTLHFKPTMNHTIQGPECIISLQLFMKILRLLLATAHTESDCGSVSS